MQMETI